MAEITTMFWDIGGVLLSNGWDRDLRRQAVEHFGLDWEEFEDRHELVAGAFDAGGPAGVTVGGPEHRRCARQ